MQKKIKLIILKGENMAEGRLQWHPAFSAAFHIELNDELENLYIEEEHMLSKKPLQIDMLIIKKDKEKAVRKI